MRRATRNGYYHQGQWRISIHALLAESDHTPPCCPLSCYTYFYPRSPCGERRGVRLSCFGRIIFLSTLSLRRATIISPHSAPDNGNFYPRSPCGERRIMTITICIASRFLSTLSLRRATIRAFACIAVNPFLSTLSLRRATLVAENVLLVNQISIHALLAESDFAKCDVFINAVDISIHALLAESDPPRVVREPTAARFLSTLSLRRATQKNCRVQL